MKKIDLVLFFVIILILIPLSGKSQDSLYAFRQGSLLFSKYQIYFPELKTNEKVLDSIRVMNDSHRPIKIGFTNVAYHLGLKIVPNTIEPGKEAVIYVEYDGSKKNDIGFITEGIYLTTTDSISPRKELSIATNLLRYFPPSSYLPDAIAPKGFFDIKEFNYGSILSGEIVEHVFTLFNQGNADLEILKIKADCGCTVPEATLMIIPPGAKSEIKIVFDSQGKSGIDMRRVMVILNDPHIHQVYLYLNGIIKAVE